MDAQFEYDKFISLFEALLKNITNDEHITFSNIEIKNAILNFRGTIFSAMENNKEINGEADFYLGTIHSAKGETHRSTLLVLNTKFGNFHTGKELRMFDLLIDYFKGVYTDPSTIVDENRKNETIKSLKLAYVALSRPTHLMTIAIPEDFIESEKIIQDLKGNSWKNVDEVVR